MIRPEKCAAREMEEEMLLKLSWSIMTPRFLEDLWAEGCSYIDVVAGTELQRN